MPVKRQRWLFVCGLFVAALAVFVVARRGQGVSAENVVAVSLPASSQTTVRFNPDSLALQVGQATTVTVRVENVVRLQGFYLRLTYDAAVMQVLDADPIKEGVNVKLGNFIVASAVPVNLVTIDTDMHGITGTIEVAVSQISQPPKSGSGVLVSFRLQALEGGPARFAYAEVGLSDDEGLVPDVLAVAPNYQAVPPTPTPTTTYTPSLTPTQTNTPTLTGTPSPTPYYYLSPQVATFEIGDEGAVTIRTSYVQNLSRVIVYLHWDPALLRVEDDDPVTAGVQVAPGTLFAGRSTYRPPQGNLADNAAGSLFYALSLSAEPGVTGAWSVATVHFTALAGGMGALTFGAGTRMANWQSDMPSGWINGEVWVMGGTDTPTPTSTATPTSTVTSTSTATPVPSETPTPSATLSPTPSQTVTPLLTLPAPTETETPTITLTASTTLTPSDTPTATATLTPSVTGTSTPGPTATATAVYRPRIYLPIVRRFWALGD